MSFALQRRADRAGKPVHVRRVGARPRKALVGDAAHGERLPESDDARLGRIDGHGLVLRLVARHLTVIAVGVDRLGILYPNQVGRTCLCIEGVMQFEILVVVVEERTVGFHALRHELRQEVLAARLLAPAFGVEAVAHLHPEVARLGNQVKAFTARIALLDYVQAVGMEIEIGERFQVGGRLADGVRCNLGTGRNLQEVALHAGVEANPVGVAVEARGLGIGRIVVHEEIVARRAVAHINFHAQRNVVRIGIEEDAAELVRNQRRPERRVGRAALELATEVILLGSLVHETGMRLGYGGDFRVRHVEGEAFAGNRVGERTVPHTVNRDGRPLDAVLRVGHLQLEACRLVFGVLVRSVDPGELHAA